MYAQPEDPAVVFGSLSLMLFELVFNARMTRTSGPLLVVSTFLVVSQTVTLAGPNFPADCLSTSLNVGSQLFIAAE